MLLGTTNIKKSNFIKIRPLGADMIHAGGPWEGRGGRSDMTKPAVAFRNFAKSRKNIFGPHYKQYLHFLGVCALDLIINSVHNGAA